MAERAASTGTSATPDDSETVHLKGRATPDESETAHLKERASADDSETVHMVARGTPDGGETVHLAARDGQRKPESAPPSDALGSSAAAAAAKSSPIAGKPPTWRPSYTRPPGMTPPPTTPSHPEAFAVAATATTPVSAPPHAIGRFAPPVSGAPATTPTAPERPPKRPPISVGGTATIGAAPVPQPVRTRPAATPRGPRRARLTIKRVDPWSVMKFSFAVSLVLFIVVIVAASVLYLALDAMGVFESLNSTVSDLYQSSGGESSDTFQVTARGVIGTAAVLGALNVLLFTSLATLGAFIYNVCADLVGGVEVTLAERD
jgi:hypothetical protein